MSVGLSNDTLSKVLSFLDFHTIAACLDVSHQFRHVLAMFPIITDEACSRWLVAFGVPTALAKGFLARATRVAFLRTKWMLVKGLCKCNPKYIYAWGGCKLPKRFHIHFNVHQVIYYYPSDAYWYFYYIDDTQEAAVEGQAQIDADGYLVGRLMCERATNLPVYNGLYRWTGAVTGHDVLIPRGKGVALINGKQKECFAHMGGFLTDHEDDKPDFSITIKNLKQ